MKKISFYLLVLLAFTLPVLSFAQSPVNPGTAPVSFGLHIDNPFKCGEAGSESCTLLGLITAILNNIVMPIAAVAVTLWIVWAGFGFLMAQGKPAAIEEARRRLLWSLIGAGILLGAAGISKVLQTTFDQLVNF